MDNTCPVPPEIPSEDEIRNVPLGAKLKFIHQAFENQFNQSLQELNLTSSQMHLLIYLDNCERRGYKVNQRQIEKNLHLSNPTVTGLLQRLEAKGFVTRTVSETDGRNKDIHQTELCRQTHEEMHHKLTVQNQKMVRGMTPEEIDELDRLLTIMLKNVRD